MKIINLIPTNIKNDNYETVVSLNEPTGTNRKKVWKQYQSEQLVNFYRSETMNNLTIVYNTDGTVTINGRASANSFIAIRPDTNPYTYNTNVNYTLIGCPAGGNYSNSYALYSDIDTVGIQKVKDEGKGITFLPKNSYGVIYIVIRNNYEANNLVFAPRLIAYGDDYALSNFTYGRTSFDNVYSPEEVRIGTWFGKPLYRKVITGTLGASGTTDVTITDVLPMTCDIVNITGSITAMNGANKQARPISLYLNYSSQENFISFILLGQNATRYDLKFFYTAPYAESGFNVLLEYTKSTD